MPEDAPPTRVVCPDAFVPRVLRTAPDLQRLVEEFTERVLTAHPAWPWPLIEEEARRRAEAVLAAQNRGGSPP